MTDTRWQPIETAPRDATTIDVWQVWRGRGGRVANVHWDKTDEGEGWACWDPDRNGFILLDDRRQHPQSEMEITHWMPLPDPPLSAEAEP